ncbi:WSSV474 [White spot syndrome virus]|uniref:WSSV474 n=1 Tax=White spot syndrome virus TaxID=342409 RepID=A0A2I6SCE1_9VIRU|nr:WSSV474 [White spot syndrome virus]
MIITRLVHLQCLRKWGKEAYEMFAHPPTAWRIASNEGHFSREED